jgi:Holliday junction DNA helicase RuvA
MAQAEALSALTNLGYAPGEAVQAVAQAAEAQLQAKDAGAHPRGAAALGPEGVIRSG